MSTNQQKSFYGEHIMYKVITAKSRRTLGEFDDRDKAVCYLFELESQDMAQGCYEFGSYEVMEDEQK